MDSPPLEVRAACGATSDEGVLLMPGVHEPSDLMREAEEAADACLLLRGAADAAERNGLVGRSRGYQGSIWALCLLPADSRSAGSRAQAAEQNGRTREDETGARKSVHRRVLFRPMVHP